MHKKDYMGQVSKQSVIIELNGLPGTGKTTISHHLQSSLSDLGYSTMRLYTTTWFNSLGISVFFTFSSFILFWILLWTFRDIKPLKIKIKCIVGFMFYFRMYRQFMKDKPCDYLIIDQGLIQECISIIYDKKEFNFGRISNITNYLKKHGIEFCRVDCILDPATSCERIEKRPTHGSRLDNIDKNCLFSALEDQSNVFINVRNAFNLGGIAPALIINTKDEPITNSQIIARFVIKKEDEI